MAQHSRQNDAHLFHGGMKGLAMGAITGALLPLLFTGMQMLRGAENGSPPFIWFFGIAFGGGIGFLAGALAARRDGPRLAHAYNGPDRRASLAAYQGIDRRVH